MIGFILITWVYNNTRRSVLAVLVLHFMQNFTGEFLGFALVGAWNSPSRSADRTRHVISALPRDQSNLEWELRIRVVRHDTRREVPGRTGRGHARAVDRGVGDAGDRRVGP